MKLKPFLNFGIFVDFLHHLLSLIDYNFLHFYFIIISHFSTTPPCPLVVDLLTRITGDHDLVFVPFLWFVSILGVLYVQCCMSLLSLCVMLRQKSLSILLFSIRQISWKEYLANFLYQFESLLLVRFLNV